MNTQKLYYYLQYSEKYVMTNWRLGTALVTMSIECLRGLNVSTVI